MLNAHNLDGISNKIMTGALLSALLIFLSANAYADAVNINLECPRTKQDGSTTGDFVVINTGTLLVGNGHEIINGVHVADPVFSGFPPAGVPSKIADGAYYRSGVIYDSLGSKVSCHYVSSVGYPPFDISYNIRHAVGGTISYQTINSIMLAFDFGLK